MLVCVVGASLTELNLLDPRALRRFTSNSDSYKFMFEIHCEKLVANERATRRSSDLRSSMPPRVTFHNASSSSSSSILDDLSASLMSLFKQPANNVPLNKKCEAFTAQLGVEGGSIHDTVHATAAALGVATEGKHLNALADECWHVIFGGEEAAPSDGFKDNDEMDLSEDSTVASVMDRLTAGEQHAECCICFDELHERVVASFSYQGKRTCPHFFHDDCAAQLSLPVSFLFFFCSFFFLAFVIFVVVVDSNS